MAVPSQHTLKDPELGFAQPAARSGGSEDRAVIFNYEEDAVLGLFEIREVPLPRSQPDERADPLPQRGLFRHALRHRAAFFFRELSKQTSQLFLAEGGARGINQRDAKGGVPVRIEAIGGAQEAPDFRGSARRAPFGLRADELQLAECVEMLAHRHRGESQFLGQRL